MVELFTQLASEIADDDPRATLRIARVTAVESVAPFRVQTDSTLSAWLSRDADTMLKVGDKVWILQQGGVWLVGGRLNGGAATPVGVINPFAGSTAPPGWLLCDGAEVSRTDYSELFSVIGTTFGSGNSSTTFNVPNLVNRVPVASGGNYSRGATGGQSRVTLTIEQIPSHSHGGAGGHTHWQGYGTATTQVQSGTGAWVANGSHQNAESSGWHQHESRGNDWDHENMPPYLALPYIIRAL